MIDVDSSAWMKFLRDTGSPVCVAVYDLLDGDVTICDAISMEILAGARDEHHLAPLRGLLGRATLLPTTPISYDQAAALFRTCRRRGETVRKLIDCLIASVALRADAELLHADADFTALARHTSLRIHAASSAYVSISPP